MKNRTEKMGKDGKTKAYVILTVIVLGCFILSAVVTLLAGALVYKKVATESLENYEIRTSLSFIATRARQYDERGLISAKTIDGIPVLVFKEKNADMETVVYHYDGTLMEYSHEEGKSFRLSEGFPILEVKSFEFTFDDGLINLTATDESGNTENLTVFLRSVSESGVVADEH